LRICHTEGQVASWKGKPTATSKLVWLFSKLTPDFKTIADFRQDNLPTIRQVCRAFILLCRDLNLLGGELVAIDGSKFKVSKNRPRIVTQRHIKRALKDLD